MNDPLNVVTRHGLPANLEGMLRNPAFLVGGGPSVNDVDIGRLRERGIYSLAVNQMAAWAPVSAWCYSDDHIKFHHGLYLDQSITSFVPRPKFRKKIAVKLEDGFHYTGVRVKDCPYTYGYDRQTKLIPEQFLSTEWAHWGPHTNEDGEKVGCICTMLIGLRLLHYLGVRRIYLIGVDYEGRDGLLYGFPSDKRTRTRRYPHEQKMLEMIQPTLEKGGVEIFNCSSISKDTLFYEYRDFDSAIRDCKGSVPDEPLDTTVWYDKNFLHEQAAENKPFRPKHY